MPGSNDAMSGPIGHFHAFVSHLLLCLLLMVFLLQLLYLSYILYTLLLIPPLSDIPVVMVTSFPFHLFDESGAKGQVAVALRERGSGWQASALLWTMAVACVCYR